MPKSTPELTINPDIVRQIMTTIRAFQAQEGVSIPENLDPFSEDFDWLQMLADHQNNLTFIELKEIIEDLEPDQKVNLLALFYVGRGDFTLDEWNEALTNAYSYLANQVTPYLLLHPHAADFLSAGLEAFDIRTEV